MLSLYRGLSMLTRTRLLLVTTALLYIAVGVAAEDAAPTQAPRLLSEPREVPDDPPGVAALPQKGARPARVISFGSFTSVQVNVASGGINVVGDAANEPSIAIDPTFPNHIAIGWRHFATITSNFRQAGYGYSRDGGRTWTAPGPLDPTVFRSDPVLAFAADGTFYYNSLSVVATSFTCEVFKSANAGMTWGPPIQAQGGDKAWMTVDRTGGMGHGHVYSAWSNAAGCCGNFTFTRSVDANITWESASSIPFLPRWGTMDVAPNGDLWIIGVDNTGTRILASCSIDAQDASIIPPLFFTTSENLGGTVVAGVLGSPNPVGLLGQVWIAVDKSSGPTAGWIYVVASVDPATSDPLDVHFMRSTDNGFTWSTPVRLNDDPLTTAWSWMATMSVAPNGRIDVVWNDTRNTGIANHSQLFYTSSSNGGSAWTTNEQLSPTWDSYLGWPNKEKIGDYYHMVSDDVGAHLAQVEALRVDVEDVPELAPGHQVA